MIILKQLERVVGKIETVGYEGKQINIPITDGIRQNRVFLNLLGRNWSYVKQALAANLGILNSSIGSHAPWDNLAIVASEYSALAKDIFEEEMVHEDVRLSANYLRLLSRVEPGSDNVANYCLAVFAVRMHGHDWFDATETAAAILAEQFRGDARIEQRLIELSSTDHAQRELSWLFRLGGRRTHS